ncbi:MAG TPA: SGNH/GDSL hydrolase family protein [Terracidiphilus sp.]|nr:SGNH/GDSL hydrolase family protein [Terracidiphilus sp.]
MNIPLSSTTWITDVSATRPMRLICAGACALAMALTLGAAATAAAQPDHSDWTATWQGSPTPGGTFYSPGCPSDVGLSNQTVRNVVHVAVGGDVVRARISNAGGAVPVMVGSATIAKAGAGAATAAGTLHPLTFGGRTSIEVAAGGEVVSDPVPLHVNALDNLDVSVYLPGSTGLATQHYYADQSNYLAAGDQTGSAIAGPYTTTISCWMFVSGVDVQASSNVRGTLIAFGDSITDGYLSTMNANHRYPDDLATAMAARHGTKLSVVNAGIIGNELLTIRPQLQFGYAAPFRFARDVLNQPGAKAVIVLEGINDIGDRSAQASDLIPVFEQLIIAAHEAGLKIYGATLTPFGGSNTIYGGDYGTPAGEAQRQLVNAWIRTSGAFDGVIDFDKAVRDPTNPTFLLPAYVGDPLHPNDAGYQAMANAVPIKEILDKVNAGN